MPWRLKILHMDNVHRSASPALDALTPDEREILELLLQGMNTSEIAKRLSLGYGQVAAAIRAIKSRLGPGALEELKKNAGRPAPPGE